jgi:hypothetical protein
MQKTTVAPIITSLAHGVRQSNTAILFFEAAQQTNV